MSLNVARTGRLAQDQVPLQLRSQSKGGFPFLSFEHRASLSCWLNCFFGSAADAPALAGDPTTVAAR